MNPNYRPNDPNPYADPYGRDGAGAAQRHAADPSVWAAAQQQATQQAWAQNAVVRGHARAADPTQFLQKVFGWMTFGLAITGAVGGATVATGFVYTLLPYMMLLMLAQFGLVMFLSFRLQRMSPEAVIASFVGYAATLGLSLSPIALVYTGGSIAQVFMLTTMTFGFMYMYGHVTKRDLTSMGSLLIMGLFGVILASILNMFIQSTAMGFALSIIGVLIFVGLTAYDAQRLKTMAMYGFQSERDEQRMAVFGALTLYLDFINLFLRLLHLFGRRR